MLASRCWWAEQSAGVVRSLSCWLTLARGPGSGKAHVVAGSGSGGTDGWGLGVGRGLGLALAALGLGSWAVQMKEARGGLGRAGLGLLGFGVGSLLFLFQTTLDLFEFK